MGFEVLLGDCIESMKKLPAESVDMCVTSPPYYSLRDYGNDKQIGLEGTLSEYIESLVSVFNEVHRVLKPEGTLWLNLGDSYNGSGGAGGDYNKGGLKEGQPKYPGRNEPTLKRKDLMGVPWRVAFALQEAGWWLRQDIIWNKPNCMPEPVKDRCTKSHEYLFMFAKQEKYYYDNQAIKEPIGDAMLNMISKGSQGEHDESHYKHNKGSSKSNTRQTPNRMMSSQETLDNISSGRNKRSVWTVSPKPYKGAHFAVFPPELIEPCILAGTSAKGCCLKCGKAYVRLTERTNKSNWDFRKGKGATGGSKDGGNKQQIGSGWSHDLPLETNITIGWVATCECDAEVVPAVVFDPFGGSGTTAGVALKHGRNAILCELNEEYAALIPSRVESITQIPKEVLNDKREWI
tara:strand:- start:4889 stop:6100 length:1212 start_codon:yes stop_codon:yes gene_type:complete